MAKTYSQMVARCLFIKGNVKYDNYENFYKKKNSTKDFFHKKRLH